VLDLCCGTGRLLLPMLETGADVDGVDLHPGMLARAQARAEAQGFHPTLLAADMADFTMPRRYASVFIPFNAFAHNLTPAAQLATLRCCRRHLEPGGLLAFDAFRATAEMLAQPSAPPVLEHEVPHPDDGHPMQVWDGRSLDLERRIQHSRIEVRELDERRAPVARHRFETEVRWVELGEIERLLERAGFARVRVAGGYAGEPVTEQSTSLIVEAWADGEASR